MASLLTHDKDTLENRRRFLRHCSAAGLSLAGISLPGLGNAISSDTTLSGRPKTLVLIELKGGNDGLNTVIPYTDPAYRASRPTIAIERDHIVTLDESFGLHPSLQPLHRLWTAGDMAVVLGTGYPDPNRSHFRSIEIWETASGSNEVKLDGWLTPVTIDLPTYNRSGIKAIVLDDDQGPLAGSVTNTLVFRDLNHFTRDAKKLERLAATSDNTAFAHILNVQNRSRIAATAFAEKVSTRAINQLQFPRDQLSKQLKTVAGLMLSGAGPQVYKVRIGSFDTHAGQPTNHARLLKELATAVDVFSRTLEEAGLWQDVTMMTYSEFGRSVTQNGSGGTDHGTASPLLLWGGAIHGGLYGQQPSLTQLVNRDMVHTVDFRSVYRTVAADWLNVPAADTSMKDFDKLRLFG